MSFFVSFFYRKNGTHVFVVPLKIIWAFSEIIQIFEISKFLKKKIKTYEKDFPTNFLPNNRANRKQRLCFILEDLESLILCSFLVWSSSKSSEALSRDRISQRRHFSQCESGGKYFGGI